MLISIFEKKSHIDIANMEAYRRRYFRAENFHFPKIYNFPAELTCRVCDDFVGNLVEISVSLEVYIIKKSGVEFFLIFDSEVILRCVFWVYVCGISCFRIEFFR